jgi:colanic acid/amylovoran biosynthesis glycosyltransferase
MTTAVIEAMATGLPIVATMHSGFPDQVVPGVNGYLSRENDYEDFAEKMLMYIEHPELWASMSVEARKLALAKYDRKPLIERQHMLYEELAPGVKKVAFIAGEFPVVSQVWFINQIADLVDRGVDVRIYSFLKGATENISERYFTYKMSERTISLDMPQPIPVRIARAIPKFLHVLFVQPSALCEIFNIKKYGSEAYSLKLLYRTEPLLGLDAELIHCHFGNIANRFLISREILGLKQPLLTSFYGFDISSVVKSKGVAYYDRLKKECTRFIVMSNNMKERVAKIGFNLDYLEVLPISVGVEGFTHAERSLKEGEPVRIISVGRFVEKKGFDDLIRALAIVKKKATRKVLLTIVGGPKPEEEKLRALAEECGVMDMIDWRGYMKSQDIIELYQAQHLYVQASKTAKSGDME